ncbi:MAG TPA: DUF1835 domain-containing protein [Cyclobacteriaceae bacterium]|nr:DUF1835 domain-containing protein [Cyclobacteriaceae bacterium]
MSNIYHVLTGDALLENFPKEKIKGSLIVNRECLIEGPVQPEPSDQFWNEREKYLTQTYTDSDIDYRSEVMAELTKLQQLKDGDEVNLWFEHDLFCQTNFWFTITLIPNSVKVHRVSPIVEEPEYLWYGFGALSKDELSTCFERRQELSSQEIELARNLWAAYASEDTALLRSLSQSPNKAFPYLKEVCEAHIERELKTGRPGRPEKTIRKIIEKEGKSFHTVFREFCEREGIYGFGDLQVKHIYDRILQS